MLYIFWERQPAVTERMTQRKCSASEAVRFSVTSRPVCVMETTRMFTPVLAI